LLVIKIKLLYICFVKTTIDRLVEQFRRLLQATPMHLERSLMTEINWDARLIGIKGARGVGKTTLLLQYIRKNLSDRLNETLYISLDSVWLAEFSMTELVNSFTQQGGKYLFLDEVHKYSNWAQELKNIYDAYPEIHLVFTGSSLLDILNARADLSRRAVVYSLQGLSFREFLSLQSGHSFSPVTLTDILKHHTDISSDTLNKVKPLAYFYEYLKGGYYPFYQEQPDLYHQKIREVSNMIMEIELPLLRKVEMSYVPRIKQLLYIISQSVPFVPNVSKLSVKMGIQRNTLLAYLHYLDEVKLTLNLFKESGGISKLQKPVKIYLENTNLSYAFSGEDSNRGNLRETFFINQLSYRHRVEYSEQGDFRIEGKYTIEVGGKNKDKRQITGLSDAYIAADEIEFGWNEKIPLWMFGFLY